jgi:flagellar biosynthesis/type III secretory pathway protein FliH
MPDSSVILRGVALSAQSVSSAGRPRQNASSERGASTAGLTSVLASVSDIHEAARFQGYQEGAAEGHKVGEAAARQEVLAQGQKIIAAAAETARQEAHATERQRLEEVTKAWAQEQRTRIDKLLESLSKGIARRLEDAEDDMVALCTEVLARMLGQAATQPEAVRATVSQAIAQVRARPLVSIALHESDLELLRALPDGEKWMQQVGAQVQWIASDRVNVGGCIVQSVDGSLDARLETQFETFKAIVLASRDSDRQRPQRADSSTIRKAS